MVEIEGKLGAQRRWLGQEPDDRRAARHARLIEAGLEIMGTEGAAAATMRATCRQARLTERYFYESFESRDQMLVAVYDHVVFGARDVVLSALATSPSDPIERGRYVIQAFTDFVAADPRRGRIMFVAPQEAPELAQRGEELVGEFIAVMAAALRARDPARWSEGSLDVDVTATAMFGASASLYQRWLSGALKASQAELVDHVARTLEVLTHVTRSG